MSPFEKAIEEFEKKVDDKVFASSPYSATIAEARKLIESLQSGPATGGGYLSWTGDLLQEAEFNLARLAEFLSMEESKADARSSFAKDKFGQMFDAKKQEIRKDWSLTRTKFTASEIEEEARTTMGSLEDVVNLRYAEYRALKNMVESIQRIMLCLTHRINQLQAEMKYR